MRNKLIQKRIEVDIDSGKKMKDLAPDRIVSDLDPADRPGFKIGFKIDFKIDLQRCFMRILERL